MNKESACIVMCIVSKNFAKALDLKREFDVAVWRHKHRTPSNNDHHTPLPFVLNHREPRNNDLHFVLSLFGKLVVWRSAGVNYHWTTPRKLNWITRHKKRLWLSWNSSLLEEVSRSSKRRSPAKKQDCVVANVVSIHAFRHRWSLPTVN